jgi:serine/threonine-protein kinase
VVTWEALTGKRLFQEDNEAAIVTAILQRTVVPPSEIESQVPLAFDRVVMRGLERDPARRYASAREMALDMERCVGVASASEVGEWVESLAHDELLKRASRVTEIESASSPSSARGSGALPSVAEMTTTVSHSFPDVVQAQPELRSDVSSIAVSPIFPLIRRRASTSPAVVAGTAVVATLVAVFLVLGSVLLFRREPAATPAALPSAVALPASVAPVPASADPPPDLATPTPTTTTTPTSHRRVYMPKPGAAPQRPDCDPPFTIDGVGHKHYKPACLN